MIELKVQVNTGFRLAMVYFKDSYKFINLPLHLLPKSFDFHNELQKGFFPHYLNTRDNLNFTSNHLPDMKYFGVEEMSEYERKRFTNWYQSESLKYLNDPKMIYDLQGEMVKYCYDDCFVLASAFSGFNKSMIRELKSSGVVGIVEHDYTILADFITLPQMVIHWFMGCMMPERMIAVVPNGGYDRGKCGSLKERIWLTYLDVLHEEEEGHDLFLCSPGIALVRGNIGLVNFFWMDIEFCHVAPESVMNFAVVITMVAVFVFQIDPRWLGVNIERMVT